MNIHEEREFLGKMMEGASAKPNFWGMITCPHCQKLFKVNDPEGNLIKQQNKKLQEEGSWIKHSKPSSFKGTKAFSKGDPDSIANPKNKPIVPFKGVNKKWGISEK
jgi:hypothetical protein